jgi:RHS repeat-associated protein
MCVNVATGEVTLNFTDFAFSGPAPLALSRMYSSAEPAKGSLGFGWTHDLGGSLLIKKNQVMMVGGETAGMTINISISPAEVSDKTKPRALMLGRNVVVTLANDVRLTFEPSQGSGSRWNLARAVDGNGNVTSYAYDAADRLTAFTDFRERHCQLRYSPGGLIAAVHLIGRGESGRRPLVDFEFDGDDDLRVSRDPQGVPVVYEYCDHLIVALTNRSGGTTNFAYDNKRRCVRTWQSNGRRTRYFDYHPTKAKTVVTDSLGWRTPYTFNEANLVVERVDPLGAVKTSMYDPEYNLLFSDDEEVSDGTLTLFDSATRELKRIDPAGSITIETLDAAGRMLKSQDAAGHVTVQDYDERGNLVAITSPLGARWSYKYDERGLITSMSDPLGREIIATRSPDLCQVRYNDALGLIMQLEYDVFGRLLRALDPSGAEVAAEYDSIGRIIELKASNGFNTTLRYDIADRSIEVIDSLGRRHRAEYDGFGKIMSVTRPGNHRIDLTYDNEDRLLTITNEDRERSEFRYGVLGDLEAVVYFDGTSNIFERDVHGMAVTRADGQRLVFQQDAAGRLVMKHFPDGTATAFGWDLVGQLVSADDGQWPLTFEYDPDGRLIGERQGQHHVQYMYDAVGRLIQVACGSRNITYRRDLRGRVVRIDDTVAGGYDFRYGLDGREMAITGPDRTETTLTFDDGGRLVKQSLRGPTGLRVERQYAYDVVGRLVRVSDTELGRQLDFEYDELDQVLRVLADGQVVQHYTYDLRGNVIASHRFSNIQYGHGNRILMADDVRFETDPHGNLISQISNGSSVCYTYGFDNELRSVSDASGERIRFEYDALLRRVAKVADNRITQFLWSGDLILEETTTASPTVSYLHLSPKGPLLAQAIDQTVFQCVFDQVGRPTDLLGDAGNIAWRCLVPWATPDIDGSISCSLLFPGQYIDRETGLIYNRTRYLDPTISRYTSADPLTFLQGLNFFTYVDNSFPNITDPLGLASCFRAECDVLFKDMDNIMHTAYDRETHVQTQPYPGAANVPHAGMVQRAAELIRNRYHQPALRLPGDPLGQRMTGESHRQQYLQQQGRLQDRLDEWDALGCKPKNTSDPSRAGRVEQDARQYSTYEPPIKHAGDAVIKFGKAT